MEQPKNMAQPNNMGVAKRKRGRPRKEIPKEAPTETLKEAPKESPKETPKETPKEAPMEGDKMVVEDTKVPDSIAGDKTAMLANCGTKVLDVEWAEPLEPFKKRARI